VLPPHLPQNARMRSPRDISKRVRAGHADAKPLARMAFGNIRQRLKKAPASLKPALRVLDEARD